MVKESQYCEDCKKIVDESTISEYTQCEMCGHLYEGDKCTCKIEDVEHNIQKESAERIRYLMSLGHPNESGEVYTRWHVMDECQRRGKQLFLDLGWPIDPEAIYKNKYTGSEATLKKLVYHLCMEKEQQESFDERLDKHGWSVIEHAWPKALWKDDQMFDQYKSKLSYFKDTNKSFSIEEVGVYDDDVEGFQDGEPLTSYDELDEEEQSVYRGEISTIYDTDKVVRGKRKVVDKAQAGLGGWF